MRNVFVVSRLKPTVDMSSLDAWGKSQLILYKPSGDLEADMNFVRRKARLIAKEDYLALVGHPLFISAALMELLEVNGEANVLLWDKMCLNYAGYRMNRSGTLEKIEP